MRRETKEAAPASLEEQFAARENFEFSGGKVEVVDIQPETTKTEIPVVVGAGWMADSKVFETSILTLAKQGRRTLCVDAFHGVDTEVGKEDEHLPEAELRKATALIELLDKKGIDQVDAVAHSEGGIYIAIAAILHPEKFRNLVLVDPGGMIGPDNVQNLSMRFTRDLLGQVDKLSKVKPALVAMLEGGKAIASGPVKSFKEVLAISGTQIQDMLRELKQQGVGISIIHGVNDKAFPMEKVQKIAKADQLDGFYSIKGTHNEVNLDDGKVTKLVDHALDALESKHNKK